MKKKMRLCVCVATRRMRSPPRTQSEITEKGGGFQRCRFVGRSNNNANANGGLVYANANNGSANSNTNIGSRLANNKNKNFNKIAPTENHHGMVNICERETQPSVKAAQCRKTETYHW